LLGYHGTGFGCSKVASVEARPEGETESEAFYNGDEVAGELGAI